ncbi:hypothetical protein AURDEDRAFT_91842 [Auricularia subglabra TFB-10046 SS5]|nr:hypothetical protein AURDEDRAFT_91842 [Auricularia subglabra TFB-10046 SS5]
MDPFEVRMQFLSLLRKLDAKQQTIQKVVAFALKHFPRCGEDLWDCVIEECTRGSIHMRINILYMLDSLCETSLLNRHLAAASSSRASPGTKTPATDSQPAYVKYVARDVDMIVDLVVPDEQDGLLNLMSTRQILETWRSKRIIDPHIVDKVLQSLDERKNRLYDFASASSKTFHRTDILSRIEEDRERHKRLRERRWVQPADQNHAPTLASFGRSENDSLDIEFTNEWETTSDWNEDDDEAALEENALCFPDDATASNGQRNRDDRMAVDL